MKYSPDQHDGIVPMTEPTPRTETCGACGGFYDPKCPQWPQCTPQPGTNEYVSAMEKQLSQARKDLLSLERSLARKEALLLEALPRIKNGAVLDDLAERIERHLGER